MTEKHIHKLSRHKYKSGNIIYHCILPDCNFKSAPALVLGKRSICNRCGEPFILSQYSIRLSKPHCENCHKPKNGFVFNPDNSVIPISQESRETIQQLGNFGVPPKIPSLAERLKRVINSHKLEDQDDGEI